MAKNTDEKRVLKNFSVISIRHEDFQCHEICPVVPSKWIDQDKGLCPWLSSDTIEEDFLKEIRSLNDPPCNLKRYNMKIITTCGNQLVFNTYFVVALL